MQEREYQVIAAVEQKHWWYQGRRRILEALLKGLPSDRSALIYDIGCGTGAHYQVLSQFGQVVGIDNNEQAIQFSASKGYDRLLKGDVSDLSFIAEDSADIVVAADILEHLDDDRQGLAELKRVTKKGGFLILMVPAFKFLWGTQDDISFHKRRYTRRELLAKLEAAGLQTQRASYFNSLLFIPIFLARKLIKFARIKVKSENEINNPLINVLLREIFSLERKFVPRFNFPFGVSIFCIARK